jgi:hypothetical protein
LYVWLVLLVAAAKHTEKQALVVGTKQSRQANKVDGRWADQAGRLTGQSGLPNLFQASLLCFVPATNILWLKWMFHKLVCLEKYIFLRYL